MTQARRAHRHGQLDPERPDAGRADPEDQLRLLAAAAGGLRQPDDLGRRGRRVERFAAAGVPAGAHLRSRATPTRSTSTGSARGVRRRLPRLLRADDERVRGGGEERPGGGAARGAGGAVREPEQELEPERRPRSRRPSCASPCRGRRRPVRGPSKIRADRDRSRSAGLHDPLHDDAENSVAIPRAVVRVCRRRVLGRGRLAGFALAEDRCEEAALGRDRADRARPRRARRDHPHPRHDHAPSGPSSSSPTALRWPGMWGSSTATGS